MLYLKIAKPELQRIYPLMVESCLPNRKVDKACILQSFAIAEMVHIPMYQAGPRITRDSLVMERFDYGIQPPANGNNISRRWLILKQPQQAETSRKRTFGATIFARSVQ